MLRLTAPIWDIPEGVEGEKKPSSSSTRSCKILAQLPLAVPEAAAGVWPQVHGPQVKHHFPIKCLCSHQRSPFWRNFAKMNQNILKKKMLEKESMWCVFDFDSSVL